MTIWFLKQVNTDGGTELVEETPGDILRSEALASERAGLSSPLPRDVTGMGEGYSFIGAWSGKAGEDIAHIFFFLSLLSLSSKRTWLF